MKKLKEFFLDDFIKYYNYSSSILEYDYHYQEDVLVFGYGNGSHTVEVGNHIHGIYHKTHKYANKHDVMRVVVDKIRKESHFRAMKSTHKSTDIA